MVGIEIKQVVARYAGKPKGAVKAYRANPNSNDAAALAALHYAIRNGHAMLVIPGNSYGHAVRHIMPASRGIEAVKACGHLGKRNGLGLYHVAPDGVISYAECTA